jgi:hypothetical protein
VGFSVNSQGALCVKCSVGLWFSARSTVLHRQSTEGVCILGTLLRGRQCGLWSLRPPFKRTSAMLEPCTHAHTHARARMRARTRRWVSALFSDGDDAGDDDLIPRLVEQVRHSFTFYPPTHTRHSCIWPILIPTPHRPLEQVCLAPLPILPFLSSSFLSLCAGLRTHFWAPPRRSFCPSNNGVSSQCPCDNSHSNTASRW